jgi:aldose sugar dehydrogenase
MKKILLSAIIIFVASIKFYAQTTDKSKIESVIKDLYFEGWMTGDTTKIGKAMHATCHLKYYRDNKFSDISRADYLSRFKPKAKEAGSSGRIVLLDITENIASAKCEIETAKALYTDYFNLIRVDERWFIMDKISTRVDK